MAKDKKDKKDKKSMPRKEFIESSLTGIAEGIWAANDHHEKLCFTIASSGDPETLSCIDFDVAVGVTKSGRGGFRIGVVNVGAGASGSVESERLSRIKFKVHNYLTIARRPENEGQA